MAGWQSLAADRVGVGIGLSIVGRLCSMFRPMLSRVSRARQRSRRWAWQLPAGRRHDPDPGASEVASVPLRCRMRGGRADSGSACGAVARDDPSCVTRGGKTHASRRVRAVARGLQSGRGAFSTMLFMTSVGVRSCTPARVESSSSYYALEDGSVARDHLKRPVARLIEAGGGARASFEGLDKAGCDMGCLA